MGCGVEERNRYGGSGTWDNFQAARDLYRKAAERSRFVLFTVDQ